MWNMKVVSAMEGEMKREREKKQKKMASTTITGVAYFGSLGCTATIHNAIQSGH